MKWITLIIFLLWQDSGWNNSWLNSCYSLLSPQYVFVSLLSRDSVYDVLRRICTHLQVREHTHTHPHTPGALIKSIPHMAACQIKRRLCFSPLQVNGKSLSLKQFMEEPALSLVSESLSWNAAKSSKFSHQRRRWRVLWGADRSEAEGWLRSDEIDRSFCCSCSRAGNYSPGRLDAIRSFLRSP